MGGGELSPAPVAWVDSINGFSKKRTLCGGKFWKDRKKLTQREREREREREKGWSCSKSTLEMVKWTERQKDLHRMKNQQSEIDQKEKEKQRKRNCGLRCI